jgi:serine/threonine protein kinase
MNKYQYLNDVAHGNNNLYFVKDRTNDGVYIAKKYMKKSLYLNETNILKKIHREKNIITENIVKLIHENKDEQINILEYITGEDMNEYITNNKSNKVNKSFILQLIDILQYLHSINIIYCDLKPHNVIVRGKDVILIDFDRSFNMDDFNGYGFSTDYAPKETQFEMPTFKSDVWSLGILIYEMYCGYTPFDKYKTYAVKNMVKHGHIDFTHIEKNDKVLFDLLVKMLDVNVKSRYSLIDVKKHPYFND